MAGLVCWQFRGAAAAAAVVRPTFQRDEGMLYICTNVHFQGCARPSTTAGSLLMTESWMDGPRKCLSSNLSDCTALKYIFRRLFILQVRPLHSSKVKCCWSAFNSGCFETNPVYDI